MQLVPAVVIISFRFHHTNPNTYKATLHHFLPYSQTVYEQRRQIKFVAVVVTIISLPYCWPAPPTAFPGGSSPRVVCRFAIDLLFVALFVSRLLSNHTDVAFSCVMSLIFGQLLGRSVLPVYCWSIISVKSHPTPEAVAAGATNAHQRAPFDARYLIMHDQMTNGCFSGRCF